CVSKRQRTGRWRRRLARRRRRRSGRAAWKAGSSGPSTSLLVAADAAEAFCLREATGVEPRAGARRLPRSGRILDQPLEVAPGEVRLAEAGVAFGQPEEQLAFRVIAERREVRRLNRQHLLVIADRLFEQCPAGVPGHIA